MEYTKEFIEAAKEFIEDTKKNIEAAKSKADAFIAGEFAASLSNPDDAEVLLVAVGDYVKEKYTVLLNEKTFNRVDIFIARHRLLHRFELKICNEIDPDNFLIIIEEGKYIHSNFTACKAALTP